MVRLQLCLKWAGGYGYPGSIAVPRGSVLLPSDIRTRDNSRGRHEELEA